MGGLPCFPIQTNVQPCSSSVFLGVRPLTRRVWSCPGPQMQEVAQFTFTYEQFPEAMGMLWKRMLQDNRSNWRRTYKVRPRENGHGEPLKWGRELVVGLHLQARRVGG